MELKGETNEKINKWFIEWMNMEEVDQSEKNAFP